MKPLTRWRSRLLSLVADETGMVTVEAAYAISAIVVVLLGGVGAIEAVVAEIRCTDAAREVARLSAAGDARARSAGTALVGSDATISITTTDDRIVVEVSDRVRLVPGLSMSARAVAVPEPDGGADVDFAPGVGR